MKKLKIKKIIKLVILLIIFIAILQLVLFIFKKKHNVTYKIDKDKETVEVQEELINKNYHFVITYKKYKFTFNTKNNYSKKKKIIEDIETYQKDDLICIYPILKKTTTNIICSKGEENLSLEVIKKEILPFIETLKDKEYDNPSWNESNKTKRIGTANVYYENIIDNTYMYVYKYNGFYSINTKTIEQFNIFENDNYKNLLGTQIDKYYVIPNYDNKYEYKELLIYNIINNKKSVITFKETISKDSYINGIIDNKLYLFDKDNLIQYEINPKKKTYKIISSNQEAKYYNVDKWEQKNIYDFKDNLYFDLGYDYLKEIVKTTSFKYIYKYNDIYYYVDEKDNFHTYNSITNIKTLLFNMKEAKSYINTKDDLYFIKDKTIYVYNYISGLKPLVEYEELIFNDENRFTVYKK